MKQRGIYSKNIYICLIMERNPTMTDIDFLLRQITTEDNKLSFQRLFELYYPALCIYTKRFISDRETREDIVQEVFSSIWENRKRIVIRTSARNYLITATKNHSLNYLQPRRICRPILSRANPYLCGKWRGALYLGRITNPTSRGTC